MKTPIFDFVKKYSESGTSRFHMPGHKGKSFLGCEAEDITEIFGADTLYLADGIIDESERYAASLFGTAKSFYSVEGSTLAIRAMLATALRGAKSEGRRPKVLAARGAHKAFITTAAILDFDVEWISSKSGAHIACAAVSAEDVSVALSSVGRPDAVYLTSPDYLGNISDIKEISKICHKHGVPLLVDNAHGAYLAFLKPSLHPIALGADMSCDSAHKTLPALTGGAYLHIAKGAEKYISAARDSLLLFASTSPSYLILQSLDLCNKYLADGYSEKLSATVSEINRVKEILRAHGLSLKDTEPLKIVIEPRQFGYTGEAFSMVWRKGGIEAEFADGEYTVLMPTPENDAVDFERLIEVVKEIPRKEALPEFMQIPTHTPKRAMSVRDAMLCESEALAVDAALGRILAAPTVSCPPAVPIAVSGEVIDEKTVELMKKYGVNEIKVVKQ